MYLPLEENSTSYNYVMEKAAEHEVHPIVCQIIHFTKSEIENCEYFTMNIMAPLELEGTDAADYGTQYEGGCSICGLGKKLVGDALINRKFMKKWDIGTVCPDIYVSEKLKDIICSNGLTGVSFDHELRDWKGREMPKFYVMDVGNVLPPMSKSVWLRLEYEYPQYKECGHQIIYLRSDVEYEKEKLDGVNDFNLSAEYVNNYRLQEIIVSAKVRNLFKKHKVCAGFFPVAIL